MKMRKYGFVLLIVLVLTIMAITIPALATDETVVYVEAGGDLIAAINGMPDAGGTVVVKGDITLPGGTMTLSARTGKVTVTGSYGGTDYNPTLTSSGSTKNVLDCYCPLEFNNLTLNHTATKSTEFYCGPSVIIGENMTFLAGGEAIPTGYNENNGAICFRGGNIAADCTDTRMEFYSGQFSYIQGGNNKYAVTNSSTIIVHSGVAVMDFIQLGGTQKAVNNVTCTLDGATVDYIYLGGYNTTGTVGGNVSLTVSDSTVTAIYGQRYTTFQGVGSVSSTVGGNVSVTLDNSSVTTVNLENLTVSGTKSLTCQDCENTTIGDSLSDFDSVSLTNSTVTLTTTYAGPTPIVDETSTLTDTTGVVAGSGSSEDGGETPDPDTPVGENVVFLSGEVSSSGDGTTPATAVKTLMEAYKKLGANGGTIVLCGNLTETFTSGDSKFTAFDAKPVTITSKYGDEDYTNKVYTLNNNGDSRATLQFTAATVFENIHLNETGSQNKAVEFYTGPSLTFGEGVVCTYNGGEIDTSGDGRLAVRTGYINKDYVAADHNNQPATFIMKSGTLSFIQGGNHSYAVDNSYICLEGTAKITVMVQGGGTRHNVGNSVIEIKSNATVPQLYVNGYSDSKGSAAMESSKITISGGTVSAINAARQDATGKLGDVTMEISGTASIGTINLESTYLTTGTQKLTLAEGLGDQVLSAGFGDGWDAINISTGNDVTINGALTVGSASVTVGENTTVYISEDANSSIPTYTGEGSGDSQGKIVLVEAPDHTHSGGKYSASYYMTSLSSGGQGNAIYGDYLFNCNKYGMCYVFDLTTKEQIASFKLGSYNGGTLPSDSTVASGTSASNWANHSNQMMFGPAKFDESDPFPLLFVTTGNSGNHDGTGAYIAKCAIERITKDASGNWSAETVQIIEFNDKANISLGSGDSIDGALKQMYTAGNGRFYYTSGNGYDASKGYQKIGWGWPASFVDTVPTADTAGKFYLYSARYRTTEASLTTNSGYYGFSDYYDVMDPATGATVNAYIITEFNLPALPTSESDPNYGGTVTLYPKDITNQFETEYEVCVTQGGTMRQGKIYYSYGWCGTASATYTRNGLQIFDIAKEKIVAKYALYNDSLLQGPEPECCSFWGDTLMMGANTSGVYKMYKFDYYMIDVDATAPTCTEAGMVAHAVCNECDGVYYSQTDYKTVLSSVEGETAKGHSLTPVSRVEPTATEDGNIAYWYCSACEKYFSDEACTNEITYAETILPAAGVGKLGDADGDGFVDAYDAALIKKYSVGTLTENGLNLAVLDLDGDKTVNAYDAALIQKYSINAITIFPVEKQN